MILKLLTSEIDTVVYYNMVLDEQNYTGKSNISKELHKLFLIIPLQHWSFFSRFGSK